ncbi:MAG: GtrA family protein [Clostridia bacterium]|nr:GtrA family protein [Clostridia bacterium]
MINRENVKQIAKFGTVGVFNTLVDYGIFYILISYANLHKSISQVIATAIAMYGSFIINKYWTFKKRERGDFGEIIKFIVVNLISMVSVIFFTHIFYDILHLERVVSSIVKNINYTEELNIMICKAFASVISLAINFLGNKLWVFNKTM